MEQRSVVVPHPELAADSLGYFRWARVAGKVLVTNDAADWAFLSESELADLLGGRIVAGHPLFTDLQKKGFLRDGLDLDAFASRMAQRNRHVRRGPHVHVVTLTLRGASAANGRSVEARDADMSVETAENVVDFALQSASPALTFELQGQGGEPLLNFAVLRHLVDTAQTRNKRSLGKNLRFHVLSNFSGMTEEAAEWLIANDILISTTLDGPASVHDANRKWLVGTPHAEVVRWIEYFARRYGELGRDVQRWHVNALMTATRHTLDHWRAVVDEYVTRGLRTIHPRPLDPERVGPEAWGKIGYSVAEYLDFYRRTLDYVLELNRKGVELREGLASILLTKILTADDPGIVDIQSPYGAGTGQVAYGVDGRLFPCEEARAMDSSPDSIFQLGSVRDLTMGDVARHPTVRAIAAASLLDAQPMCADCWNKPFCGFSPLRNFKAQGDLFGQRFRCFDCKEHMVASTRLFEILANEGDTASAEILKRWTVIRPPHAVDGRAAKEAP